MIAQNKEAIYIYKSLAKKKKLILVFLIIAIIVGFFANILIGSSGLSISEVFRTILGKAPDDMTKTIVWEIRLPMALMGIVVGAALAVGGCEMQTILRNPMASPYTLGISSAASFGAATGMILGVRFIPPFTNLAIPINAFFCTMIVATMMYLFTKKKHVGKSTIVLFGIALSFMFNALTAVLQYIATEQELQGFMFWSFGDLTKATWEKLFITIIVLFLCLIIFTKNAWKLTALSLSDSKAISLGVDVQKMRRMSIVLISMLSATAICFVGTIGFIGLVAPHLARMLVGEEQRFLLPISALIGGLILSVASIVSKIIIPGVIIPIGIVTSFIGVPFFLVLIFKGGRNYM
ncbi:FecCD family ABC transporter permease [Clostridium sp. UBA6640]|uniref:FecCD family ABC transporter permease n=1 Tax=Clostridium sp. UBA6640 TaxID=1946370 RepID=UPI0025BCF218|nr:iron ABC transporter permease [Clostridium sp. UBA6640]